MAQSSSALRDSLDTVTRLEDLIKHEQARERVLSEEKRILELDVRSKDKELEKLAAEIDQVRQETGWAPGIVVGTLARDHKHDENLILQLQNKIQKLEEEQRIDKNVQRKQTQLVEQLTRELDGKRLLEEELVKEKEDEFAQQRELQARMHELKDLKQVHVKKDKLIYNLENQKDDQLIRALEADKRVMQSEIAKLVDIRRQQERCIKAQQFRIEMLETRLDALSNALRELKAGELGAPAQPPPDAEAPPVPAVTDGTNPGEGADNTTTAAAAVATTTTSEGGTPAAESAAAAPVLPAEKEFMDIELYELLQQDVRAAKKARDQKNALLQEKDGLIEALERKSDVLSHSQRSEARMTFSQRRELAWQVEDLKKALDLQQATYGGQVERLKDENERLKKRLEQLTQQ